MRESERFESAYKRVNVILELVLLEEEGNIRSPSVWNSVQGNILGDFLLPLGLHTNHGYAKRPVENYEVAEKRTALEKRLANVHRGHDIAINVLISSSVA